MSKLESALKQLAKGAFVCETRYSDEYEALSSPEGRRKADEWLGAIGYRLARLSDDGAFFMAHSVVTTEMRAGFRDELKNVRSKLEPIVKFLETIRQAQGRNPQIHAGDMLWESELIESIRNSPTLEARVTDMRDISGARVGESLNDRVRRMLTQMETDGYVVEKMSATLKGYRITGKIDYLYQLIDFIAANTQALTDEGVDDQMGEQLRIESLAPLTAEASATEDPTGGEQE